MNKLNNILAVITILFVGVALISLGVTIKKIGDFKTLTGYATDIGTANLSVHAAASVTFVTKIINWGDGMVDETPSRAYLDSEGNVGDGNWSAVSQGLTLQNDGNVNVTINLTASNTAVGFIGGTAVPPRYYWKVSNNETNSCGTGMIVPSIYTNVTGVEQYGCLNMSFESIRNRIDIDVNITVPENALPGAKGSTITATATAK